MIAQPAIDTRWNNSPTKPAIATGWNNSPTKPAIATLGLTESGT